jgi:hypothetical protein
MLDTILHVRHSAIRRSSELGIRIFLTELLSDLILSLFLGMILQWSQSVTGADHEVRNEAYSLEAVNCVESFGLEDTIDQSTGNTCRDFESLTMAK